ncbi:BQ5605_C020g09209 [Microbotryum silenes-dioicae]|uniref:peptide-methionine (S)-S-oxide reductase n=1 Tax=Microbotryum silenes-dioicae TaxID=796604 RepID=A0A2X0MJX6_9BASI|nr:BQ5605_C020g09209 [Microbotryum silenes-dioicae]
MAKRHMRQHDAPSAYPWPALPSYLHPPLTPVTFLHFKGLFAAATVHAYTGPTLPTAIQSQRSLSTMSSSETAIFANGCFWGTEHMFRKHFIGQGLKDAKVGYIGGKTSVGRYGHLQKRVYRPRTETAKLKLCFFSSPHKNPSYREVCSGSTQHAEAVKLEFDPSQLSYATLVEFHYRMHDPTQVDRQGPDRGTQYRSAIFTTSDEQAEIAKKVTKEVQEAHFPNDKIATKIEPAGQWWDAETYHQEYLDNNPGGYECPTHRLHW